MCSIARTRTTYTNATSVGEKASLVFSRLRLGSIPNTARKWTRALSNGLVGTL